MLLPLIWKKDDHASVQQHDEKHGPATITQAQFNKLVNLLQQSTFSQASTSATSNQAQDSTFLNQTLTENIVRKIFKFIFYLHLLLISLLIISLTIYNLIISPSQNPNFHPMKWYPPLLTSILCAGVFGFTWKWITLKNPKIAIKTIFWLSPILTCAMAIMLVYIETTISLTFGVIALISSLIQSLYGCWINRRLEYANKILSTSIVDLPIKTMRIVFSSTLIGIFYCFFSHVWNRRIKSN
ncbi:unnamed protein product [Vicia faba]|uniref:Uncharacterized protein n=1 Tax=Vicia faba TaxID=3906 RepID=A0AAV0ZH48_VICFA|nr:unnamed protein product [Vicia faba]